MPPSPGETPAPAISGNSTTQTASTPDLSALPQTALHHLSSLAQKSSAGYNKLSASAQSKFHEAQDKIRAVECSKLPAEAQAKLHSAQDRIRAVDLKSLPASAQSNFQEVQEKIHAVEYSKLPASAQAKFHEVQDRILAVDYKSLPADVVDWIKAHPYQTGLHVVGGVVLFAPGLVAGPVLGLLGWTSVGPRAGG